MIKIIVFILVLSQSVALFSMNAVRHIKRITSADSIYNLKAKRGIQRVPERPDSSNCEKVEIIEIEDEGETEEEEMIEK